MNDPSASFTPPVELPMAIEEEHELSAPPGSPRKNVFPRIRLPCEIVHKLRKLSGIPPPQMRPSIKLEPLFVLPLCFVARWKTTHDHRREKVFGVGLIWRLFVTQGSSSSGCVGGEHPVGCDQTPVAVRHRATPDDARTGTLARVLPAAGGCIGDVPETARHDPTTSGERHLQAPRGLISCRPTLSCMTCCGI